MKRWPPERRSRSSTRPSATRSCATATGCASRSCATRGTACGPPGSPSCCCASRASSSCSATRRGSRACRGPRPTWSRTSALRRGGRARRGARRALGRPADLAAPAPARPRRPRRADGGHARAAPRARRRRRPAAASSRGERERRCGCRRTPSTGESAASSARVYAADLEPSATTASRRRGPTPTGRSARPRCCRSCARSSTSARGGQLHALAQRRGGRLLAAEERLGRQRAGRAAAGRPAAEDEPDFAVRWGWADGTPAPGFTAVVRVKDEARALPWVLPQLLRAAERVVLIDNGSTDGTPELARSLAAERARATGSTCTPTRSRSRAAASEHLATPAASLHSLAHFYNWSFAHVRTGYALKWDGDMVLTDAAAARCATSPGSSRPPSGSCASRAPALRRERPDRLPGHGAAQLRAVGVAEPAGLRVRQGDGVGAADVPARRGGDHAARPRLRRAQAPRRRRVRPLVADRLRGVRRARRASGARSRSSAALAAGREPPAGVLEIVAPAGRHVIEHVRDVVAARPRRRQLSAAAAAQPREPPRAAGAAPPGGLRGEVAQLVRVGAQVVELARPAHVLDVRVARGAQPGEARQAVGAAGRRALEQHVAPRPARARARRGAASGRPGRTAPARPSPRGSSGARSPLNASASRATPRGSPGPRISSGTRIDGS